MKFIPLDYEVIYNLRSSGRSPAVKQPRDIPGRVITIFGNGLERLKKEVHPEVKHREGFFFEDKGHDWTVDAEGYFRYFSRTIEPEEQSDGKADAVAVYQWMEVQTVKNREGALVDGDTTLHGVVRGLEFQITVKNANASTPESEPYWLLAGAAAQPPKNSSGDTKAIGIDEIQDRFDALLVHARAVLASRIAASTQLELQEATNAEAAPAPAD